MEGHGGGFSFDKTPTSRCCQGPERVVTPRDLGELEWSLIPLPSYDIRRLVHSYMQLPSNLGDVSSKLAHSQHLLLEWISGLTAADTGRF